MDFYSNSKPNLIGPKVKNSVNDIVNKNTNNSTISDTISSMLTYFYKNYISDNKFVFITFIIFAIFLLYRYYNKESKDVENFTEDEQKIIDEIFNDQTDHLRYDSQPSFNSLLSVNDQSQPVNYPPMPIPVNIPDKGIVHTKNLYEYSKPFETLNNPSYDYNNVYTHPSRSYYTGTYNTYDNAKDTNIINPLGHLNNFNTSTGDFVGQMTDANQQNILDYQTILDNTQGQLVDNLKIGPNNLDEQTDIEPPYA